MNRLYKPSKIWLFILLLPVICLLLLSSCAPDEVEEVTEEEEFEYKDDGVEVDNRYGGTLEVSNFRNVGQLDPDQTTAGEVGEVAYHILEGLFELNEDFEPVPHLAESYDLSDNGKVYTFKLREGVPFHNGQEMTAEDVKASMERWLEINNGGQMIAPMVESLEVKDTYEIELTLNEVYVPLISVMAAYQANQKLNVWPKELLDQYGEERIIEPIGTGPYKLADFAVDEYVILERFEDYESNEGTPSAYAGERIAYFDKIVFRYVPEEAVRLAGTKTGEYHVGDLISIEQMEVLEAHPEVQPLASFTRQALLTFKTQNPPADEVAFRQAINYAIDNEELANILVGVDELIEFDPSFLGPPSPWHVSDVGEGTYNVYDPEKAKELLDEIGYDGEPIVFMGDSGHFMDEKAGTALEEMLSEAGINLELNLVDRATLVERRSAKDHAHILFANFGYIYTDPQVFGAWFGTKGFTTDWDDSQSREMDEIFERMQVELNDEKRLDIVREWHEKTYDNLHYIKLFNYAELATHRNEVQNLIPFDQFIFFNVWFEE